MKRLVALALALALPGTAATAQAAEKFGLIFDIQGPVEIQSRDGKTIKLEREKHVLYPVQEGDRLKPREKAKVVVVSLKDKTGYEVLGVSDAVVESNRVKAIRGVVKTHKGYSVSGGSSGPIGAIILRGPAASAPVRALYPADTAVVEETPELRWSSSCAATKVSVRVLDGDRVVYETQQAGTAVKLPVGLLQRPGRYLWKVDAGASCGSADAEFTIPAERAALAGEVERRRPAAGADLPARLSYLFFLIENNLRENARQELEKLQREFPSNGFLKEI